MLDIILATSRPEAMTAFFKALLSDKEVRFKQISSGTEVLAAVRASAPHLVVIDTGLPDIDPPELVQELLMVNAMVNTAIISPLSEAEFHEKNEGLGVLSRLPMRPDSSDAVALLQKLRKILGH
jgi:DNA-binding response OmpR family regulator